MIKIDNIIGLDVYTSNGLKLDVRKIKGNPINESLIKRHNDVWEVVGIAEPPKPC